VTSERVSDLARFKSKFFSWNLSSSILGGNRGKTKMVQLTTYKGNGVKKMKENGPRACLGQW